MSPKWGGAQGTASMREEVEPKMAAGADKKEPNSFLSLILNQSHLRAEREFADLVGEPVATKYFFLLYF